MTDILVIDDDPVYGELTLERLESAGYSAQFHLGPFGSLNVIRQVMPKLLILDINMPGLDGTAIIELMLKSRGLTMTGLRLILHSSLDQAELEDLARKHGADVALNKSTSGEVFLRSVARLLSARRSSLLQP